jgi:predicted membrane protein
MESNPDLTYSIPARYRKMENSHILFWLLKDIGWCMGFKTLGIVMIFPTLIISLIISYRTRQVKSELAHNLAVTFWITANSYWMISEFLGFDETVIWKGMMGKHLAMFPFAIGMLILGYYYLFQKTKEPKETQVATL